MKKYTKVLALALALTMLMGMSVFAAGEKIEAVTGKNGGDVVSDPKGDVKFDMTYTYTDTNAEEPEMFLLLVLQGEEKANPLPDKDNILYVNQVSTNGGTATFSDVYPKNIDNSTIYLAGGGLSGLTPIGTIVLSEPEFVQGDVTGDDKVTIADAVAIRRWLINKVKYPLVNNDAGDVTGDDKITIADAVGIRRWLINKNKYPFQ